jgi:hypothetical protein
MGQGGEKYAEAEQVWADAIASAGFTQSEGALSLDGDDYVGEGSRWHNDILGIQLSCGKAGCQLVLSPFSAPS